MTDTVEPLGAPDAGQIICPKCSAPFEPKRSNQKYCSRACQKNAKRGNRVHEYQRMNKRHMNISWGLSRWLYTRPVDQRLGAMKELLDDATAEKGVKRLIVGTTILVNATASDIRRVLTDPRLLRAGYDQAHLFYNEAPGSYKTIAQAANAYTRKFFGVSIQTYLKQAREGALNENHPVAREVTYGAVPRLNRLTRRNVRCWHRPLSTKAAEEVDRRFAEDMARVSAAVNAAQARVDAYYLSQTRLAANF